MIRVRVRTILTLKKILGKGEVEFSLKEGTTLEDLVSTMVSQWRELAPHLIEPGNVSIPRVRFMINGRDIAFLDRMGTVLEDEDEVLMLPPVSGG
ncbi:MAG: MoaD/ThiS family protein [Desulfobacteraceae bacterium]|nr:MAG: MoaD/ThiS family protein [Desulfobacteraceae bacterium]